MDFFYGLAELFNAMAEVIASAMSQPHEKVAKLCEENKVSPCDLVGVVNSLTKEIRTDMPYFDPRDFMPGVVTYLAKNDFIYDENSRGFRER